MKKGLLGFVAGLLSGMMIIQGVIVFAGRDHAPVGEVLIIPLILILLWFGWDLGKTYNANRGFMCGKAEGIKS